MKRKSCLGEEQLLDLYYGEAAVAGAAHRHLETCSTCRQRWDSLIRDLGALSDPIPEGGDRALAGALRLLDLDQPLPTIIPPSHARGHIAPATEGALPTDPPGIPAPFDIRANVAAGEIMTIVEVAEYLRVHPEQIRQLLPNLPHLNIAGTIRIRRAVLEEFLTRMEQDSVRPQPAMGFPAMLRRDII